jgi:hypothetical protein
MDYERPPVVDLVGFVCRERIQIEEVFDAYAQSFELARQRMATLLESQTCWLILSGELKTLLIEQGRMVHGTAGTIQQIGFGSRPTEAPTLFSFRGLENEINFKPKAKFGNVIKKAN